MPRKARARRGDSAIGGIVGKALKNVTCGNVQAKLEVPDLAPFCSSFSGTSASRHSRWQ